MSNFPRYKHTITGEDSVNNVLFLICVLGGVFLKLHHINVHILCYCYKFTSW